jgi:hypothetical protein
MGRNALRYVIEYTNGTSRVKGFANKRDLAAFIHAEGDHVSSCKRFYPDEQHEEEYVR